MHVPPVRIARVAWLPGLGVGLGKTFIGLMVLEYPIEHKRKRVALFVPKAARKPVWERTLKECAAHLRGAYSRLMIFNHTDLTRNANEETDYPRLLDDVKERADMVVIDEAHHFRNPGYGGTGRGSPRVSIRTWRNVCSPTTRTKPPFAARLPTGISSPPTN